MKKQLFGIFLCMVCMTFIVEIAYAQEKEVQIKGTVVNERGQPLGGNTVSIIYQNHKRTPNLASGRFMLFIGGSFDKNLLKVQKKGYIVKEIEKNTANQEWKVVMSEGEQYMGILLNEKMTPISDAVVTFTAENHEEKSITNKLGKFYFYAPKNEQITNSSYFEVKNEKIPPENISISKQDNGNVVMLIFGKPKNKTIAQHLPDTLAKGEQPTEQRQPNTHSAVEIDTLEKDKHNLTFDKIIAQIQAERSYISTQNNQIEALIEQFTLPLKVGEITDPTQKKAIQNNLLVIRDNLIENEQLFENFQEKNRLLINRLALLAAENDSLQKVNSWAIKKLDSIIVIKEKIELQNNFATQESRKIQLMFVITAAFLCLLIAIFFLFGRRERKKNKELAQKNQEIEQHREKLKSTNEILENRNQEISKQNNVIESQRLRAETFTHSLEREVDKQTYQLKAMLDKMTKQNEDLKQFSYIISHNIRSPIAHLLGLIDIFNREDMNDPFNKEVLDRLHLSSQNLDMVIRDLTQIISIRNNLNRQKEKINIAEIIAIEKDMLKSDLENSKAILIENLAADNEICAIRSYAQSIVHNLLSNAIKYKARSRQLEISIKTSPADKYLCFSIQDNGIGMEINEFNKEKLFGLYQRMHDHVDGKGLGLYMVKTQVEALGGKIEVESKINEGTIFTIYFPKGV